MKSLAFVAALALLPLAAPASAAEISTAAPVPTLQQQIGMSAPLDLLKLSPAQSCSVVRDTSCSRSGSTTPCFDACNDQFTCICTPSPANPRVLFWSCPVEC
jgi:hypothetical protein